MAKGRSRAEFISLVRDLTKGTYEVLGDYVNARTNITMLHRDCGHVWKANPDHFVTGGRRCPKCAVRKPRKSIETFKKEVQVAGGGDYEVVGNYVTSRTPIRIKHVKCGNEWDIRPNNFLFGKRCPKCSIDSRSVKRKSFDSKSYAELVWNLTENEYSVLGSYLNNRSGVLTRHNICGYSWSVSPSSFVRLGSRCPRCKESRGERRVREHLEFLKVNFVRQYTFEGCRNKNLLPFDFGINIGDSVIPIEYDGEQHSRPVDFAGRGQKWAERQFRRVQRNDAIKTEYCRANDIPLIRIDYTQFDEIEAILDRELSALGVTGKRNNTDNNDITRKEDAA